MQMIVPSPFIPKPNSCRDKCITVIRRPTNELFIPEQIVLLISTYKFGLGRLLQVPVKDVLDAILIIRSEFLVWDVIK